MPFLKYMDWYMGWKVNCSSLVNKLRFTNKGQAGKTTGALVFLKHAIKKEIETPRKF